MNNTTLMKAYMAALANALIIGFSFIFVKIALQNASPTDILAHRFTVSLIAAVLMLLVGRNRMSIPWSSILRILPLALFYPAFFFGFQTFGLVYASSSEAGIITAMIPILTMILASMLLGERTSLLQKLFMLLSVGGVVFIFVMNGTQTHSVNAAGMILILLSALSMATYTVLARKWMKSLKLSDVTFVTISIGFIVFNAMSLAGHAAEGTVASYFKPFTEISFVTAILYLAVLSSVCTSLLTNYAISRIEASKMSVFNQLSTVVSIGSGAVILNETLVYYHFIGTVMILAGVIGVCLPRGVLTRKKRDLSSEELKEDAR
ncbi:DMT family transporter [Paenibacillus sp. YPG26]|uniref:DMT family transporter n=1 Tax=Paenibacillus sp. YPG26 TaxID=2878915 RepID=UPI00203A9D19|nr:DMT family transporter [Paenibacillus sp. YPG26]USB32979.1 DMT family transporter [Paenibacillus sp. YPG26]